MQTQISKPQANSYQNMMNTMLIASLNETNFNGIIKTGMIQEGSSGLSHYFSKYINGESHDILSVAATIWNNINIIKECMEIRSSINEKCMYSMDESKELLETTQSLQKIVAVVSDQEEKFIELYQKVNEDIYKLYINYTKILQTCNDQVQQLTESIITQSNYHLDKKLHPQSDIADATQINTIMMIMKECNIANYFTQDPYELITTTFNHEDPKEFILIQVFTNILARQVRKQSIEMKSSKDIINLKNLVDMLTSKKDSIIIDIDKDTIESFEQSNLQQTQALGAHLEIKPDIIKKINESLTSLSALSHSRKPKDPDTSPKQADDE